MLKELWKIKYLDLALFLVIVAAAALAGGSEAINKVMKVFNTFMASTQSNMAKNRNSQTVVTDTPSGGSA